MLGRRRSGRLIQNKSDPGPGLPKTTLLKITNVRNCIAYTWDAVRESGTIL